MPPDSTHPPHLRHTESSMQLVVAGQPWLILGGELHNSCCGAGGQLDDVCRDLAARCLNTILAPIYWETMEPAEGEFDFAQIQRLLAACRVNGLKLIPLWFGTYKNASSSYAPGWVRTDTARFPRVCGGPPGHGRPVSPFCEEALACDAKAFSAMMRRLRELDQDDHTVVMLQVENEAGILKTSRDLSPDAQKAFAKPVPSALTEHLALQGCCALSGELARSWSENGRRTEGTWQDVFGDLADEVFMSWHVAGFIDRVAEAGRKVYDLPMFANAWIQAGPGYLPGEYPSGGPIAKMIDVWQAAAKHIDLLAPDIYQPNFREICVDYTRASNPLFVPESLCDVAAGSRALYVFGAHQGVGFAPFGIDRVSGDKSPLPQVYGALSGMMGTLAQAQARGATRGFLQESDSEQWSCVLNGVRFTACTTQAMDPERPPGAAMLVGLGGGSFIAVGTSLHIGFEPESGRGDAMEILYLEEGRFQNEKWQLIRRLNGDETEHGCRIVFPEKIKVFRFKLFSYKP